MEELEALAQEVIGNHDVVTSAREIAPTMGRIAKLRYSHTAMIDLIVSDPWISQNDLAARFGYSPAWVSNILASDAFQSALAARREEIVDPVLKATMEERAKALLHRSLTVLMEKLDKPVVSDAVALKAAELGAKMVGIGGHAVPSAPAPDRLERLAERLIALQTGVRERLVGPTSIEGQVLSREVSNG